MLTLSPSSSQVPFPFHCVARTAKVALLPALFNSFNCLKCLGLFQPQTVRSQTPNQTPCSLIRRKRSRFRRGGEFVDIVGICFLAGRNFEYDSTPSIRRAPIAHHGSPLAPICASMNLAMSAQIFVGGLGAVAPETAAFFDTECRSCAVCESCKRLICKVLR
jgi:hypothetical protein